MQVKLGARMPEDIVKVKENYTGQYLKPMLERAPKPELVETKPVRKPRKKALAEQPDLLAAK